MHNLVLIALLLVRGITSAQPNAMDPFINPCGFAPNDSVDVTNDDIPDFVIAGYRSGTDDVPSSSGSCHLHVVNLPGTTLLNTRDAQGYWRSAVLQNGDSIAALDTRPQNDLQIPKELYTDGNIQVAYWGYGHQSALVTIMPNLSAQYYVYRTMAKGRTMHGSFSIEPPTRPDDVRIRMGVLVPVEEPFVVR